MAESFSVNLSGSKPEVPSIDVPALSRSSDTLHDHPVPQTALETRRTAGGLSRKLSASDEPHSCQPVATPGIRTLRSSGSPPSGSLETLSYPPPAAGLPTPTSATGRSPISEDSANSLGPLCNGSPTQPQSPFLYPNAFNH